MRPWTSIFAGKQTNSTFNDTICHYTMQAYTVNLKFYRQFQQAIVSVTAHFEKHRILATGLAVCGTGVGTLAFSHLVNFLMERYTWRFTLIILAAIVLSCVILGAFFRPLSSTLVQRFDSAELFGKC